MNLDPPAAAQLESPGFTDHYDEVTAGFRDALATYSAEIRRYAKLSRVPGQASAVGPLRALSELIAQIPGNQTEFASRVAAAEIRASELRIVMGSPFALEGEGARAALEALDGASDALLRLAQGPYRRAPAVLVQARVLDAMVERLQVEGPLRLRQQELSAAFFQAERVVEAIYAALARGGV